MHGHGDGVRPVPSKNGYGKLAYPSYPILFNIFIPVVVTIISNKMNKNSDNQS